MPLLGIWISTTFHWCFSVSQLRSGGLFGWPSYITTYSASSFILSICWTAKYYSTKRLFKKKKQTYCCPILVNTIQVRLPTTRQILFIVVRIGYDWSEVFPYQAVTASLTPLWPAFTAWSTTALHWRRDPTLRSAVKPKFCSHLKERPPPPSPPNKNTVHCEGSAVRHGNPVESFISTARHTCYVCYV